MARSNMARDYAKLRMSLYRYLIVAHTLGPDVQHCEQRNQMKLSNLVDGRRTCTGYEEASIQDCFKTDMHCDVPATFNQIEKMMIYRYCDIPHTDTIDSLLHKSPSHA